MDAIILARCRFSRLVFFSFPGPQYKYLIYIRDMCGKAVINDSKSRRFEAHMTVCVPISGEQNHKTCTLIDDEFIS